MNMLLYQTLAVSKNSQQNNSETVTNEHDKEIPEERFISLEKKTRNYWWTVIKIEIMEYQKITNVSKNSEQNNSRTIKNENNKEIPKEIPKERYISPEERQKNTDKLDINIIV